MFHHKCAQIQKKCWKIILFGDMASMSILVYYCHHQNLSVNVWRNFGAFHSMVFLWNFPLTICTDWWSDGYFQTKRLISLPAPTITITHMKKNKNERMGKKKTQLNFFLLLFSFFLYFSDLPIKQSEAYGEPVHTFSLLVNDFIHLFLYVGGVRTHYPLNITPWHIEYFKLKFLRKQKTQESRFLWPPLCPFSLKRIIKLSSGIYPLHTWRQEAFLSPNTRGLPRRILIRRPC